MGLLQTSIILAPDILANIPAAGSVPIGAIYCVTNSTPANQLFRNNGATWDAYSPTGGGGSNAVTAAGTLTSGQPVLGAGTKTAAVGPINLAGGASFVTGILPVANGGSGIATGAQIRVATGQLTNANLLALPSTPITLVASFGANTTITPLMVTLTSNLTTAYTGISTTYAALQFLFAGSVTWIMLPVVNDNTVTGLTQLTDFLAVTTDHTIRCPPYADVPFDIPSTPANGFGYLRPMMALNSDITSANFQISLDNNGSPTALGGGNALNTVDWRVYYVVETMP